MPLSKTQDRPSQIETESRGAPAPERGYAIRTRRLRKVFGDKIAVRCLNLDVYRGEVFGFLGPNGAGKSTSVKMLLGLVRPTSGSAELLDKQVGDRSTRARVGFLPEHFRFYDWLTPSELLLFHGQLYGIGKHNLRKRIPELIDLVGLAPHRDKQIRKFSKGMLQRIGLAQALLNEPDILFLDEPTSGLDPLGRRLVRDIIKAQRDRGVTVFLNSHLLSEVEITCDRVAFIRRGEVIEVREMSSFSEERRTILVRAHGLNAEILNGVSRWGCVSNVLEDQVTLQVNAASDGPEVLRYLVSRGVDVFEFTPQKLSLEQRFLEIVGGDEGL